jgi:glyoxylase-like metal-dependent hydrolase (beta-lactamase superfamily II)
METRLSWTVAIIEVGVLPGCVLRSYVRDADPEAVADLPCYCWLLRDGAMSVLVDTGPDAEASAGIGYHVSGDTRAALAGGLRAAEAAPDDIGLLLHTHLHQDHVQNDTLFTRAEVVVQRRELDEALAADAACKSLSAALRAELADAPYPVSQAAGIWYIGTESLVRGWRGRANTVDGDHAVLPGLRVIWNGGHTAGHQSVVAETEGGLVCIAGDIVSLAANAVVPGPMTPDEAAAEAFLARAHEEGWELVPSHDPSMRQDQRYVRRASAR